MKITHEELGFILKGLEGVGYRYLNDYHAYMEQGNEDAANDCLAYYKKVYQLRMALEAEKHDNGTDVAYELV